MFGKFVGRRVAGESGKESDSVLDEYLGYLRSMASVEPAGDGAYCLTLPFWSLPATKDSAVTGSDNPEPWVRLYVTRVGDDWEISDRGENLSVLTEIGVFDTAVDGFQKLLSSQLLSLGPDNALQVSSDSGLSLGKAIHNMTICVGLLDSKFDQEVWQAFGQNSPSVFDLAGDRINFEGDARNPEFPWVSKNFQLSSGALAVSFEHEGIGTAKIDLVRDDPGIFDSPTTLFELDGKGGALGLWRVAEGEWRDPHPDVSYHLQVSPTGRWECTMLQPELGQVAVQFPYSTAGVAEQR